MFIVYMRYLITPGGTVRHVDDQNMLFLINFEYKFTNSKFRITLILTNNGSNCGLESNHK